jgi:hypothetical protein
MKEGEVKKNALFHLLSKQNAAETSATLLQKNLNKVYIK